MMQRSNIREVEVNTGVEIVTLLLDLSNGKLSLTEAIQQVTSYTLACFEEGFEEGENSSVASGKELDEAYSGGKSEGYDEGYADAKIDLNVEE